MPTFEEIGSKCESPAMKPEDVVIREHHEPLVQLDPTEFELRPQYFKQQLTDDASIWLREGVVEKLRAVKAMLPPGWTIRIWDGWRSMELQTRLYDRLISQLRQDDPSADATELTDRAKGFVYPPIQSPPPPHTTGGTIDLTLVDASGEGLNFGTGFDDFSPRSALDYFEHRASTSKTDQEAKTNRQQLQFLMEGQDFVVNPKEWWHWTFGTAQWAAAKGVEVARYGSVQPPVTKGY